MSGVRLVFPRRQRWPLVRSGLLLVAVAASAAVPVAAAEALGQRLREAGDAVARFDFDRPQATFRAVRAAAAAGSLEWQEATFGLALCRQQATPASAVAIAEADALFAELVTLAPTSSFAPRAELTRGRIAELVDFGGDPVDLPAARRHYQAVIDRWGDDPIAGEAALRLSSAWSQEASAEGTATAITVLETWIAAHPQDPLAAGHWQYLGDRRFELGDQVGALAAYQEADRRGLLWRSREHLVWWRMARLAEAVGQRAEAVRCFTRICTDAQTSDSACEAQMELARLGAPVPVLSAFAASPWQPPVFPGQTTSTGGRP